MIFSIIICVLSGAISSIIASRFFYHIWNDSESYLYFEDDRGDE